MVGGPRRGRPRPGALVVVPPPPASSPAGACRAAARGGRRQRAPTSGERTRGTRGLLRVSRAACAIAFHGAHRRWVAAISSVVLLGVRTLRLRRSSPRLWIRRSGVGIPLGMGSGGWIRRLRTPNVHGPASGTGGWTFERLSLLRTRSDVRDSRSAAWSARLPSFEPPAQATAARPPAHGERAPGRKVNRGSLLRLTLAAVGVGQLRAPRPRGRRSR